MGQSAVAIMLGTTDALPFTEDGNTIIIAEYAKHLGVKPWYDPRIPQRPREADTPTFGFFVACGGSGYRHDDGVADLEPCAIEDILTVYAEPYQRAAEQWAAFAAFAASKGVTLSAPKLWITMTETA